MIVQTDVPGYVKDTSSKAVLRTDISSLKAHRRMRKSIENKEQEINILNDKVSNLENDVDELKEKLNELLLNKI